MGWADGGNKFSTEISSVFTLETVFVTAGTDERFLAARDFWGTDGAGTGVAVSAAATGAAGWSCVSAGSIKSGRAGAKSETAHSGWKEKQSKDTASKRSFIISFLPPHL